MISRLKANPLVPVLRKIPFDESTYIIESMISGGVQFIEITLDTEHGLEMIRDTTNKFSDIWVGAGTVLSIKDCMNAIQSGAKFLVSPVLDEEVVLYAVEQGVPIIPGVYSPTEMLRAYNLGATAVKLFPASSVGSGFVKDVLGPLSHIPIMVTGGITLENARSYIDAGAIAVGAGSSLVKKDIILNQEWSLLAEEVSKWIEQITT